VVRVLMAMNEVFPMQSCRGVVMDQVLDYSLRPYDRKYTKETWLQTSGATVS
jgi:hypothetical protein